MSEDKQKTDHPRAVKIVNAVMHGLTQLAVWGVIAYSIAFEHLEAMPGILIGGALTGLGAVQMAKGQPPTSAIVAGGQAVYQALRHFKGLGAAGIVLTLSLTACSGTQQAVRDVTDHVVFRGTLGGLLGACSATQGAHAAWDTVCDAAQQIDAVGDLLQGGAGPAELPPEVASRECVAFEDGRVECEG